MKYSYIAITSLALMLVGPQDTYATRALGEPDELTACAPSEGEPLVAAQPSHTISKLGVNQILRIPKPLLERIGNESGNTINLKRACRFLNSLKYNTVRVLTLPRNFPDPPEEAAARYRKAIETRGDDVQVLNLYQLQPDKDLALFGNFVEAEQLKATIECMNKGRVRNIKRIVLRKGMPLIGTAGQLPTAGQLESVDQLLEQNKIEQDYLDYAAGLDQIFRLVALEDGQIRLLIELYKGDTHKHASGNYYVPGGELELSEYMAPKADPAFPMDHRLAAMLDLYGQITATKDGKRSIKSMRLMRDPQQMVFFRHCLQRLSDYPDMMAMIKYICSSYLCHGQDLFHPFYLSHYSSKEWIKQFDQVCHGDTQQMLELLRAFIPEFDKKTDFRDGLLTDYALRSYVVINMHGIGYVTRMELFLQFIRALGQFDKSQQYVLLKRLLPIISLKKIGEVSEHVLPTSLCQEIIARGLKTVNQPAFLSLADEDYADFAAYFQEKHGDVNPLSKYENMGTKLLSFLEEFQRHKGGSAAKH